MGTIKTIPIARVKNITKETFVKEYYKPQRPVLIEDLTRSWPAYEKWNLDYIQSLAGDQIVPLYNNEPTKGRKKSVVPAKKMKLYDYIEILKSGPTDLRMFFYNVLQKMPELTKDFSYPDIGLPFFKKLPVMFFGGKGSKVLAHYDMDLADLLHVHFHGEKTVTLFRPDQAKYLYKVPFTVHNLETIDMDNPDFTKYPALQQVEGISVTMKHGDALYMPSGYWHYITYLNGGFSITLRAFPRHPKKLAKLFSNLLFMRNFENIMRRTLGQKWIDYKENRVVARLNRRYSKQQHD
ncbi:MAG: cupin-like domain-containing protein [Flavobacteriales bacterium]|jgi:ribosomal protein L16 Arg81 hydroxylase|uniref:cupin-like domain-containing protein n=1 Tax=Candidatus Ulvibacter alkanivorans TaxID=2267620 RepID=UPI000DF428C8|nr:cupin-like domain-containing protein [Candidatus Ulvibacter alkanivorans]MCH2490173.1 cupin-like domain-containing protein [Flavobacteriales bacterium]